MIDTSDEREQAWNLADLLYKMYEPRSVVDAGCNTGLYLQPFKTVNKIEVLGIDYDREALHWAEVPVVREDLRFLTRLPRKYDLCLCLEVLEHIHHDSSYQVIDNLCFMSDKIIFSAAQPGAGGDGHVNCREKEHWQRMFQNHMFEYCKMETEFIVDRMKGLEGTMGWFINNLMVFRRYRHYPIESKKPFISDVTAVVTSCGRFDLLKKTLDSFELKDRMRVIIRDDSTEIYQHNLILNHYGDKHEVIINGWQYGQAKCLDHLYSMVDTKYILHMEDDWEFIKPGAVEFSKKILDAHPEISIVQLDIRPEYFEAGAVGEDCGEFYRYKPWKLSDNHLPWNGWCGSPHLMRKSDWEKIGKFSTCETEKEYDNLYANAGMKTVWSKYPFVKHIGYGRSVAKGHTTWL